MIDTAIELNALSIELVRKGERDKALAVMDALEVILDRERLLVIRERADAAQRQG